MMISYKRYELLLELTGLNSNMISKATGINQSTLSNWKTGKSRLKIDKLSVLAYYFGVGTEFFFDGETENKYDMIKDYVFISVCNADRNQEMLKNVPHEPFLDLTLVYNLSMGISNTPDRHIRITNSHLESWGIDERILKTAALESTKRIRPVYLERMGRFLREEVSADSLTKTEREMAWGKDDFPAYILSSQLYYHGAAYMFDKASLIKVADDLQGNLVILPISVHMVLLTSDIPDSDTFFLTEAKTRISKTEPDADDFLSNRFYRYEAKTGILSIIGGSSGQSKSL